MSLRIRFFFQLFKDTLFHAKESHLRFIAASLAYSTILGLIPFLALTLVTFKMIGGLEFLYPKVQYLFLQYFKETSGSESSEIVRKIFNRIEAKTLGSSAVIFLIITSWRLLHDVEAGVQKIWTKKSTRSLPQRIFLSWLMLFIFPLALSVYLGFRSLRLLQPLIESNIGAVDFFALLTGFYFLYKILPDSKVRNRAALAGAAFCSSGILLLKSSFALIAKKAFNFDKIYGGLAAIPLLLFWILLLWYIVLLGVAMSSMVQKKLDEDINFDG